MIYERIHVSGVGYPAESTSQILLTQAYNSYMQSGDLMYLSSIMQEYFYLTRRGYTVQLPAHVLAAAAIEGFLV